MQINWNENKERAHIFQVAITQLLGHTFIAAYTERAIAPQFSTSIVANGCAIIDPVDNNNKYCSAHRVSSASELSFHSVPSQSLDFLFL